GDRVADLLRHPARALDELPRHGTRRLGRVARLLAGPARRFLEVSGGDLERTTRLGRVLPAPARRGELLVVAGEAVVRARELAVQLLLVLDGPLLDAARELLQVARRSDQPVLLRAGRFVRLPADDVRTRPDVAARLVELLLRERVARVPEVIVHPL